MLFFIDKKSYYKSILAHVALLFMVIMPASFFFSNRTSDDNTVSSNNIKMVAISEEDYYKVISKDKKISIPEMNAVNLSTKKIDLMVDKKEAIKDAAKDGAPIPAPLKKKKVTIPKPVKSVNRIEPKKKSIPDSMAPPRLDDENEDQTESDQIQNEVEPMNISIEKTTIFGEDVPVDVLSEDVKIPISTMIAMQIEKCWNEYHDENIDASDIVVSMTMSYSPDGSIRGITPENKILIGDIQQEIYQNMLHDAKSAVTKCSPLKGLPSGTYNQWRMIKFNFKHSK